MAFPPTYSFYSFSSSFWESIPKESHTQESLVLSAKSLNHYPNLSLFSGRNKNPLHKVSMAWSLKAVHDAKQVIAEDSSVRESEMCKISWIIWISSNGIIFILTWERQREIWPHRGRGQVKTDLKKFKISPWRLEWWGYVRRNAGNHHI